MIRRITSFVRSPEGISTTANLVTSAFGLVSFFFITRTFSSSEMGQWFMFLTGSTLADMFRIGLVNNGFVYHSSGRNERETSNVYGSGITLFTMLSIAIALMLYGSVFIFPDVTASGSSWRLFFIWYPVFSIASVPHNVAEWIAQSRRTFGRTVAIRMIVRGGFLGAAAWNFFHPFMTIDQLAGAFVIVNAAASIVSITVRWTPVSAMRSTTIAMMQRLLHYGKFNSLTQVGANLLRSSDTFFLGSVLGPVSVARYGVPAKLLEIVELPLRGFGAAAFPHFSKLHRSGNIAEMQKSFIMNVSKLTLLVLPFVLLCAWQAERVVMFFGGGQYRDTAVILRFFLAYCLLIPFDRFSGIFIDSLGKPQYNSMKVWLMLGMNCLADIFALSFYGTAESVAAASLVTFSFGTIMNIIIIKHLTGWKNILTDIRRHSRSLFSAAA